MRRISLWMAGTVVLLVLLFTYRTSTAGPAAVAGTVVAGGTGDTGVQNGGTAPGATWVDGTVSQTRWGPVQVKVQLSGQTIVDVVVLQQPNGNNKDVQINSAALPRLRQQVLKAQSANIAGVSGATVTSDGYRRSLRAALTAAGVA